MSNKTQLQTNNTVLDGYIARINAAKDLAASLPEASGGSEANFETSVVTLTNPALCEYLGIDFQSKNETTSTFETVKNSIVFIAGNVVGGSGCTPLLSLTEATIVRLTDTIVNITISFSTGAD